MLRQRRAGADLPLSEYNQVHVEHIAWPMPTLFAFLLVVGVLGREARSQVSTPFVYNPGAKLSQSELREDFTVLRQAFEEGHAGLYRYSNKTEMDAAFDRGFRSIDRDMTLQEFYSIATGLLGSIKCGHTQIILPSEVRNAIAENAKQFPLKLYFVDGKAFVVASPNAEVAPGAELLAIDGKPMLQIVKSLMQHMNGDGDIVVGKYRVLNERFGLYYYLMFEQPDSFMVEYTDPANKKRQTTIPAMTSKDGQALAKGKLPKAVVGDEQPWRLELVALPNTARLIVTTFAPPENGVNGQSFAQFLETSFQTIRKNNIQDLIIDLRGNDGGENYGPLLYSYIAKGDFDVFESITASTNKLPTITHYSHLTAEFNARFEKYLVPVPDSGGRYAVKPDSEFYVPMQHPQKNPYRGRVWVLIDGEVFSNGTVFCSLAKIYNRGVFIGEETGGAYQGFNAGDLAVITLPTSKLRVVIPLLQFKMAIENVPQPNRGVLPDAPVQSSVRNVIGGVDADQNAALDLIKKARSEAQN